MSTEQTSENIFVYSFVSLFKNGKGPVAVASLISKTVFFEENDKNN